MPGKSLYASVYFVLSTLLTWWFVILCPVYVSNEQMILSTSIAGGKWAMQIVLALALLRSKSWLFIKEISFVCFVGSCILVPYIVLAFSGIQDAPEFFFGSLIVSVLTMIVLYYRGIKAVNISMLWWYFWLVCLCIAISLQLTVVFHYIGVPQ
jgi:hypothetical protein